MGTSWNNKHLGSLVIREAGRELDTILDSWPLATLASGFSGAIGIAIDDPRQARQRERNG